MTKAEKFSEDGVCLRLQDSLEGMAGLPSQAAFAERRKDVAALLGMDSDEVSLVLHDHDGERSAAVFARLLNTCASTVQKWEIAQKRPTGTALKLLHLVHWKSWRDAAVVRNCYGHRSRPESAGQQRTPPLRRSAIHA